MPNVPSGSLSLLVQVDISAFPAFSNILQPTSPPSRNDMLVWRLRNGTTSPNFVPKHIAKGTPKSASRPFWIPIPIYKSRHASFSGFQMPAPFKATALLSPTAGVVVTQKMPLPTPGRWLEHGAAKGRCINSAIGTRTRVAWVRAE